MVPVGECEVMPIYRLLQEAAYGPEEVQTLASVFDDVCGTLGLAQKTESLRDPRGTNASGLRKRRLS
jgi:hypothetical protein